MGEVMRAGEYKDNGHLIAACHQLGYLTDDMRVWDATYGLGVFWSVWRPRRLVASDGDPAKSPLGRAVDFTDSGWSDGQWDAVMYDPPYKLNGTPDPDPYGVDGRFGVHEVARWQDRMKLMHLGVRECARVTRPGGMLLVKCMNQVVSGRMVWQVDEMTKAVTSKEYKMRKVDELHMVKNPRPQPGDRKQRHAHANYSTLIVFRKGKG